MRNFRAIWSEIFVRSEAKFSCDLKRNFRAIWSEIFVRSEATCAIWQAKSTIWSEIRYLKRNLLSEARYTLSEAKLTIWSESTVWIRYQKRIFVRSELKYAFSCDLNGNSLSEAHFAIWNQFFVKTTIWSKIFMRSVAISAIWNKFCDLKYNFHAIWFFEKLRVGYKSHK